MTTYDDLTPLPYFGDDWGGILVAVGWLGMARPYARGSVDADFVAALIVHLRSPWQPAVPGGFHRCELCRLNDGPSVLRHAGKDVSMGSANLFVPGDGVIYCAPSLIAHYIDAHEYRPPEVFMRAVLDCPPSPSTEYRKRLLASGGGRLLPSSRRTVPERSP